MKIKKIISAFSFIAIISASPSFAGEKPQRGYPDAFQINVQKEEIYKNNDDWTIYYPNMDWDDFLMYMMVLSKKGYEFEGGTPDFISNYVDYMETSQEGIKFPVSVTARKKGWAKVRIQFFLDGAKSPTGKIYNMSEKVRPGPDLLAGRHGPSLNPEEYTVYLQQAPEKNKGKYLPR